MLFRGAPSQAQRAWEESALEAETGVCRRMGPVPGGVHLGCVCACVPESRLGAGTRVWGRALSLAPRTPAARHQRSRAQAQSSRVCIEGRGPA